MKNILVSLAIVFASSSAFSANVIELNPDASIQIKANDDVTVTCKSSPGGLPLCKVLKTELNSYGYGRFQIFQEFDGKMEVTPLFEYGFYQDDSNKARHQDTAMTETLKQLEALRTAKICR